jgi:hypothetical protein
MIRPSGGHVSEQGETAEDIGIGLSAGAEHFARSELLGPSVSR